MYEEETEEQKKDDKTCPNCGLRQYSDVCASCATPIEEEDLDKKKEDDYDEYDWRDHR